MGGDSVGAHNLYVSLAGGGPGLVVRSGDEVAVPDLDAAVHHVANGLRLGERRRELGRRGETMARFTTPESPPPHALSLIFSWSRSRVPDPAPSSSSPSVRSKRPTVQHNSRPPPPTWLGWRRPSSGMSGTWSALSIPLAPMAGISSRLSSQPSVVRGRRRG